MGPDEKLPARLRDIHKECLRLAGRHYTSKEIARDLRISRHTVDQRLRYATRQMGATSRFEAARRFNDYEAARSEPAPAICEPVVYQPAYIPLKPDERKSERPVSDEDLLAGTARSGLHDAQPTYSFGDMSKIEALLSTPVSTGEALRLPLGLRTKSLLVVGIAAISLLAFGAAVAALEVLSRI